MSINKTFMFSKLTRSLFTATTIALFLSACGGGSKVVKEPPAPNPPAPAPSPYESLQGIWHDVGSGVTYEVIGSTMKEYHFNSFACVVVGELDLDNEGALLQNLTVSSDKRQLVLSSTSMNPIVMDKESDLPETCQSKLLDANNSTVLDNFDFFWHTFNDYYAFFNERALDWQGVYDNYRAKLNDSSTDIDLQVIISEIGAQFTDGHTSVETSERLLFNGVKYTGLDAEVYRSPLVDSEDFWPAKYELKAILQGSTTNHLVQESIQTLDDSEHFLWGRLPSGIGYLRIDQMLWLEGAKVESGVWSIQDDVAFVERIMPDILADLSDVPALIVDVRHNQGGSDLISQGIAKFFNPQERVVGSKFRKNRFATTEAKDIVLPATENAYDKPVYLLAGQDTRSAAEIFTLMMGALEHVTHVGQSTQGMASDTLEITMPNGWTIELSHEAYLNADGELIEVSGVTPDIEIPLYSSTDVLYRSDSAIDYIVDQLALQPSFVLDRVGLDDYMLGAIEQKNIAGISVAVIRDGKQVFSNGYGFADIANQIRVTPDTPFMLGSTTKAFLGTSIAQLIDNQKITLDSAVSSADLGFAVSSPHSLNDDITLKHLVTHTSTIKDSNVYDCSYYLLEDGGSFYNTLFSQNLCSEGIPLDTNTFLQEYLSESGGLFSEDNFIAAQGVAPGQQFEYSNVGAGLAAFAVESLLNMKLTEQMQNELFTPLAMENTSFDPENFTPKNPLAKGYALDTENNPIEVPAYSYPTVFDGALYSSANDMANFMLMIANDGVFGGSQIISKTQLDTMLSAQTDVFTSVDKQGIFWRTQGAFVGHNGGDVGVNTVFQYNPYTRTGVILQVNTTDDLFGKDEMEVYVNSLVTAAYRFGLTQ